LDKAIRIGALLAEQKASLKHGEFIPWIKANLPFTERTAQNYMRLYDRREQLKNESVSYLNEAYRLLTAPKTPGTLEDWRHEESVGKTKRLLSRIVATKHAIGKRILRDYDKFGKPEYGNKTIVGLAKDLMMSRTDLHHCIAFARKFPNIEGFWASQCVEEYIEKLVFMSGNG
jgi:hypothetical protein